MNRLQQESVSRLITFEQALRTRDVRPEYLALLIASDVSPALDLHAPLALLDRYAEHFRTRMEGVAPGRKRAEWFLSVLTDELGFHGNVSDYGAVENSLLDVVLERRTGLPIMLCLVCHAIGHRTGVAVDGLGFPGHFMARYRDEAGEWILDPFNDRLLEVSEVEAHLAQVLGKTVHLGVEHFAAFAPAAWAQRILYNLHNAWLAREERERAARTLEYLLVFAPANPNLWREHALVLQHAGRWEEALHDLRRYFFLRGEISLVLGPEQPREQLLTMLSAHDRQLFAVYQQLIALVGRFN